MSAPNIIQLRQLLREKMPQVRLGLGEEEGTPRHFWSTGLGAIDDPLGGGIPRGVLTEVISARPASGCVLFRNALLARAAEERQILGLIDGSDSFEVTAAGERMLRRLLWVRCRSADEALKAADLLLRDRNVPLLILDLAANSAQELRRIPSTVWFRFQRILEQGSTACLVFTPKPMVSPAQVRIALQPRQLSLQALEDEAAAAMAARLKFDISDARRNSGLQRITATSG